MISICPEETANFHVLSPKSVPLRSAPALLQTPTQRFGSGDAYKFDDNQQLAGTQEKVDSRMVP